MKKIFNLLVELKDLVGKTIKRLGALIWAGLCFIPISIKKGAEYILANKVAKIIAMVISTIIISVIIALIAAI